MNPKSRSVMLLVPLIAMLSVCGAFAAVSDSDSSDGAASLSGAIGGCNYVLSNNVFTISPIPTSTGISSDFPSSSSTPWNSYKVEIAKIVIEPGVTTIGNFCFADLSGLSSVIISETVTSIGSNAFMNCPQLREIIIPSSVTSIGNNAFMNCYSLAKVVIPSSVTTFGSTIFSNCYDLEDVILPEGMVAIPTGMFLGCRSLVDIVVPSTVTSISSSAFTCCYSLAKVVIPASVTSIGNNAFENCYSLEKLTIPEGITEISNSLFQSCHSLKFVDIPSSVSRIGDFSFRDCRSLVDFVVPSTVTSIGNNTFLDCCILQNITFKGSVLPDFGSCSFDINGFNPLNVIVDPSVSVSTILTAAKDTRITINDRLPTIVSGMAGPISWDIDNGVLTLSLNGSAAMPVYTLNSYAPWYRFAGQITSVIMDSGIRTISDYAFYNCCNLETVSVSSNLISIGKNAFQNCYSLESIDIPYGVSNIGDYTFQNCHSLMAAGIPSSVTSIGNYAFQNCYSLMAADFKCGLKTIGNYAFQNCYSLKDVSFPPGMDIIGSYAFESCYDLDSVIIPAGLRDLGNSAFYRCYSISDIELPSTVALNSYVFCDCHNVKTVRMNSNAIKVIGSSHFQFSSGYNLKTVSVCGGPCSPGYVVLKIVDCKINTISFNGSGCVTTYPSVSSIAGSVVYLPDAVQDSTGYVLEGWYHKETGKRIGGPGDAYTILPAEDGWLFYPVFQESSQRITCDPDNGKDPIIVNIPTGSVIKAFPDVSKEGYTFAGWYTDRACTVPYIQALPVDSDLTLYAGWSAEIIDPTVPDEPDSDAGIIAVAFCVIIFVVLAVALSRRS